MRDYTATGLIAAEERLALVVLESSLAGTTFDLPLSAFIAMRKKLHLPFEDEDFKEVMTQMTGALAALHK